MARVVVRGGKQLAQYLAAARKSSRVKQVDVGFFRSARYPDGQPVSNVASWAEFGTQRRGGGQHSPPRPFMRGATAGIRRRVRLVIQAAVRPGSPFRLTQRLAARIGLAGQAEIQRSLVQLRSPPNAPSTIAAKGSSNPLVDTGVLKNAVTFKVVTK